ncbi:alpha-xenorhabdolysin family binary toxin subunit A [Pseudomonas lurida]|uniref:alpha-xenorhabdolysin family binary toxin subunit A n=1 Tax=Pseudomonas lurida TaxID=244566 RepID=UPI001F3D5DA7|nr:alpha-xenorhabdolysin family binary toxin subunit A [Pseudomonas lurida]MCF5327637.1 alpha-xenorhabdolysin family binary toxin subunit A [Pseudomonas lurida]
MEYSSDYLIPIVTSDDVRVISRYVSTGKLLPLTPESVKKEIPNAHDALVSEIVTNYKIINTHANSWEKTQYSMLTISSALVNFSYDIHEYGEEAVNIVTSMTGYKSRKISELTESELSAFPSISLDGDDQGRVSSLEETIKYIKNSINEKKAKSTVALLQLAAFRNTMLNTLEPWVGKMIQSSNPDLIDTEILKLTLQLNQLKEDRKELIKQSNHESWIQIISLGIVRKPPTSSNAISDLTQQLTANLVKLTTDKKLKEVLHIVNISMGSLYDVVNPAIRTLAHLHSHWENIILLIDDSLNQFKRDANYAYLGLFVRKLEALLRDWRTIEENSTALEDAFRLNGK